LGPGIEDDELVCDPVSDQTWRLWKETSRHNTDIYVHVFQVLPGMLLTIINVVLAKQDQCSYNSLKTDTIYKLSDIVLTEPRDEERLQEIKGLLIDFPMNFLRDEVMAPTVFEKEFLVPKNVFV
jgi:phospholipase D1/2